MKTNNHNQNTTKTPKTPKTEPSAEDKALAELVRKKVLDFTNSMKKVCKDNGLSFNLNGWVEDPVDRGDSPDKTLSFKCGKADVRSMVVHQILYISAILQDCVEKLSYNEVTRLVSMSENLITYACKKVMTNLNNKTKSETKEN